ncbi:MAG TPA: VOC family protein [Aggregatilinea sp.]|jgi:predicted 3-demethylubiquinone-9 3-methyltransferase (glyoxalase superfamily)|uniref:VOC family protein n=1 Tax=Aggregatilinea sp. TaxID=2806333 RepID=UPI002C7226C2|nr:VOC family protein [Aggregatilinea sp.]HML21630.1 VOC family protein [Aggregatilinea sp.]
MPSITPHLWFDTQAEEAAKFYVSIFENSRITGVSHYTEAGPMPAGTVLTVTFELDGQRFVALNGGPEFKFNPSISLMVHCDSQNEIDRFWKTLTDGGKEDMCGWLTDKYGLSWQIVPSILDDLMLNSTPEQANRVMGAIFDMKKLDIARLKEAYAQG